MQRVKLYIAPLAKERMVPGCFFHGDHLNSMQKFAHTKCLKIISVAEKDGALAMQKAGRKFLNDGNYLSM